MSFHTNYVPQRNGDIAVKFMSADALNQTSLVQQRGYQDFSTLSEWYQENPLDNHLGLMSSNFGTQGNKMEVVPFYQDMLNSGAILETNGWEGKFWYDMAVETDNRTKTTGDTSHQTYPGIGGTEFDIILNREFAPGTKITCNAMDDDGMELVVSSSVPVNDTPGGGFLHRVYLATDNEELYYPSELLKEDIEYFDVDHGISEYGEPLALVHMPGRSNYITFEFQLGAPKGVETFYTGKADSIDLTKRIKERGVYSQDFIEEVQKYANEGIEVAVVRQMIKTPNGSRAITSVANMMQMLAIKKFNSIMSTALMFGRGFYDNRQKGGVRYNEGAWHQFRRGFIQTYPKKGGYTRTHLQALSNYVFKENPSMEYIERVMRLKVGSELHTNIENITSVEANAQLNAISNLLGSDSVLPSKVVKGSNLYDLEVVPVKFSRVTIPGVGKVETVKDIALDYGMTYQDRRFVGVHAGGKNSTTYAGLAWDITDQRYSNNGRLPQGVTNIGGNDSSNVYMVVPKGDKVYWGTANGRYSSVSAQNIIASRKTMTEEFFIYGSAAVWIKDPSKFVMIELEKGARRGYN